VDRDLYLKFAAAYVRGVLPHFPGCDLPAPLKEQPLNTLSPQELRQICDIGQQAGMRLHRYKRSNILPRVQRVLGTLKGIRPSSLLDIGSGRGAFLWPLLDSFPFLPVVAIDASQQRASQLLAVAEGGLDQLTVHHMDVTALAFENNPFDAVTALEVLEHIPQVQVAIAELARVARRFVIVSVPSKEDNNPEHIHHFTSIEIRQLFRDAGITQIKTEYVHNHMIVIAAISHARH
jgi:cyclopropane fatty-acyl-phospholipid synthase-like methyltransferase